MHDKKVGLISKHRFYVLGRYGLTPLNFVPDELLVEIKSKFIHFPVILMYNRLKLVFQTPV
jgi:hypothetical protein